MDDKAKGYLWVLKTAGIVGLALSVWDGFSGDHKLLKVMPLLFGIVVVSGITVVIDQLEEIRRNTKR